MRIKRYETKNRSTAHEETKSGKTFGFEFECVPRDAAHEACLINRDYKFVPTFDDSLPADGVELKTPMYYGRRGLLEIFRAAAQNVRFNDRRCGQHINIGDTNFLDATAMVRIRRYAPALFGPLEDAMWKNYNETVSVYGRYFNIYCRRTDGSSRFCRNYWLNLRHNNRMEIRIAKFVSPEQYYDLVCMWADVLDCLDTHFLRHYGKSAQDNLCAAQKAGAALVHIFDRYAARACARKHALHYVA